ncbi:catecholate siderophore receptor Fiu [Chitinimonas taiwanensis]|uniref:catecholate siderophore receptor Fiu n=1 Tax=Chitinimonas taiwanensis TaxID=240412 RepID=UPI0035B27AEA
MAYITSKKHSDAGRLKTSALASALMLAMPAGMALAAEQADGPVLPAVKVEADGIAPTYKADKASSPKLTQPLVDTPQTITVVKKELLQEQAATTLSDALRNTPGITMLLGENGNTATGDSIFMRGFDTQGSIFVDGIRDLGGISRDTFNTEQVEIAKGPAGADNGRGAASGYVNMSSKLPSRDNLLGASVTVGSGDYKRVTADVNRSLPLEGAAFRLNVMKQDSGVDGRDHVENDVWGVAPSVAFGLNSPTRAYFYLLHMQQDARPDGGLPTIGLEGFDNASAAARSAPKVDTSNFYGSLSDHNKVRADMFTARVEHDFAQGVTLRNTSRFGKSNQLYAMTGTNGITATNANPALWTATRNRQGRDQENLVLTNQTNLNAEFATGSIKHTLSAGLEVTHEMQDSKTRAIPTGSTQVAANLYAPSINDVFQPLVYTGGRTKGETNTTALYVFDTLKLNERFQLNGGLRFEHYNTVTSTTTVQGTSTPQNIPVGTLLSSNIEDSDNLLSLKVGALYKPTEKSSVYLSYATSQLPPGSANFSLSNTANNANNPNVDPQKGRNIELGTKWDVMGDKLALTAAIYESENKNEFATLSDGTTQQVGTRRVRGVELNATGIVTKNWQISTGLAYMDPKITRGSTGGNSPTDGGVVQWSPRLTFTTWNSYKLPFGLTVAGGARYVDSVRRTNSTTVAAGTNGIVNVPDYWVLDAMAAYELNKNTTLQLNVFNLADKEYVASLNNSGARYLPGAPRSVRLSGNFLF